MIAKEGSAGFAGPSTGRVFKVYRIKSIKWHRKWREKSKFIRTRAYKGPAKPTKLPPLISAARIVSIHQTHLDTMLHKAVRALGYNVIDRMSDPQVNLLDRALARLVAKGDSADAVSDLEIEGQYEKIMRDVLPTGSHEQLME